KRRIDSQILLFRNVHFSLRKIIYSYFDLIRFINACWHEITKNMHSFTPATHQILKEDFNSTTKDLFRSNLTHTLPTTETQTDAKLHKPQLPPSYKDSHLCRHFPPSATVNAALPVN